MSDRYVFHASKETVESEFSVETKRDDYFQPHYNITPGSIVPVVFEEDGIRKIHGFRWGMIPENAKDEREGLEFVNKHINELEEDELTPILKQRRCLVPASGFYKWKTNKKKTTPFYIRLLTRELFAIGAIYSVWKSASGRDIYSFSMLTTQANALIQPVGDTMPVILRPENYDLWLQEAHIDPEKLDRLLKPYLLTEMAVNRVSEKINDQENNDPSLIQPIPK